MKEYISPLSKILFLITCLKVNTQTLTCQYNCPQPGQLFSIKTSSPVAATSGLNKIWNFTQVQAVSTSTTMVSYVFPSSTPSANSFSQATVAKFQSGKYTFLETGSGAVKLSTAANVTVNAQSIVLPFPFHYGSSHTETIISTYYNGTTQIEIRTTKKMNGVGTGTLLLPTGTYTDVLLISGQTIQSLTIAGVPDGNIVTNNFSYFYSEKISHPLLYSEYKWETGTTDYAPYTEFIAELYTGIASEPIDGNRGIILSPNPCSDFLHVTTTTNEEIEISVINALGETVHNIRFSGGNNDLDLSDLPVGLYTLLLSQPEGVQYRRLVISR